MKTLETNDWIILNTIIYKVYTMEDFDEMRKELLEQLKLLVDFDSADFYLASVEDEKKLDRPVMYNCDSNLSEEYEELDYSRGIMLSGKSLIYRETDIISDESRVEMEYYKKVYKPNNWHYSLQVVIAKDHHFLGTITFYRTIGKEHFCSRYAQRPSGLSDGKASKTGRGGRRKAYGNAGRGTIWTDAAGGYDPSKSDAGKGKSGDLRGTDHQHQYAQKTYFKHIPETGNTQSCTTV